MTSGGVPKPGPVAPPLTREPGHTKTGHSEHRRPGRKSGSHPQAGVTVQYFESVSSAEELKSEFPSVISEMFKEDLAYRALARKFLWEFFD